MKFVAFERALQGTGASRRLRISGRTPGIVYGGESAPQSIEVDHNALWHALRKDAFHSSVLEMDLGGTVSKVLLRDVQYHPFRQLVQHVDFQRVDARTRMTMKVPLHFVGADDSEAVKTDRHLINHVVTEIEVSCMPGDLPESIEVDLSVMKKGSTVTLKAVKLPRGVRWIGRGRPFPVLATATAPSTEEDVADAAAAAAAAPAADPKAKGKSKKG